jgi:hypothetical protein
MSNPRSRFAAIIISIVWLLVPSLAFASFDTDLRLSDARKAALVLLGTTPKISPSASFHEALDVFFDEHVPTLKPSTQREITRTPDLNAGRRRAQPTRAFPQHPPAPSSSKPPAQSSPTKQHPPQPPPFNSPLPLGAGVPSGSPRCNPN